MPKSLKELEKGLSEAIRDLKQKKNNEVLIQSFQAQVIKAFEKVKVEVPPIEIPKAEIEVKLPDIKVPEPKVTVNIPEVKIPQPKVEFPDRMEVEGDVGLKGITRDRPLPVILFDLDGKPVDTLKEITNILGGGSSGFRNIHIAAGDNNIGDVDVRQVSDAVDSVNVVQLSGTAVSVNVGDADAGTQRIVLVRSPNATTISVSVGADASTSIVPTQVSRKSIAIGHASSSNLYLSTGTASSSNSMPLVANQIISFEDYVGPINAIAEEGAGTISVRYMEIV